MRKNSEISLLMASVFSMLLSVANAAETTRSQKPLSEQMAQKLDCVIQPSEIIELGAPVSGVIEKLFADRSDAVTKGQLLVQLESEVEQATVNLTATRAAQESAIQLRQASLALGYITLERSKELLQNSAISAHDMDQVNTDIRIAELNLRQEKDNRVIASMEHRRAIAILEQRKIKSPVDGVIVDRYKSMGERVDDDAILSIAQINPLNVEVIIPATQFGKIKRGMVAEVSPLIAKNEIHRATVDRIDQVIDASSSTFRAVLNLPNPNHEISSGLRCKLNFVSDEQ